MGCPKRGRGERLGKERKKGPRTEMEIRKKNRWVDRKETYGDGKLDKAAFSGRRDQKRSWRH